MFFFVIKKTTGMAKLKKIDPFSQISISTKTKKLTSGNLKLKQINNETKLKQMKINDKQSK